MMLCLGWSKRKRNKNPTVGSSSSTPLPPWIELPKDVTANILGRLGPEEILNNAQRVFTSWRIVCGEPILWRVIDMRYIHDYADSLCRRAVDRSQGGLIEISIKYFGSDDLLRYISERSSHLKILSLHSCVGLSALGLTTALKNLSCLGELHLFLTPPISGLDIETIGVSCPVLNSFTFNKIAFKFQDEDIDNSSAFSIGKSMPNLRRLHLVHKLFSDEGVATILDGCPNLELLDLQGCFNVHLQGDLGKRCSEQIKVLRRPMDS